MLNSRIRGCPMNRKLLAFLVLTVAILVAIVFLVNQSRYRGPQGAATGEASGCGGEAAESSPDSAVVFGGDVSADMPAGDEAPAQVIYRQLVDGKECVSVTVEPLDRVATVDDACGAEPSTRVIDLDKATAEAVLDGYYQLHTQPCADGQCPPGQRVEVLTVKEEKLVLPYQSPLKESIDQILKAPGAATSEAPPEDESAPAADKLATFPLTLTPEQGAVFANGASLPAASPMKVDVICYASSKTVDIQAGAGPTMANQKHLKLFRTPGGTVAKFSSLSELPDELPGPEDRDMVHHAAAGNGFVVENNVSPGYTRVLVKEATQQKVVLEYQMVK